MDEPVTDFLVSKSGIVDGVATLFDLSGSFYEYNSSRTSQLADAVAIQRDWERVAKDMCDACSSEANETV